MRNIELQKIEFHNNRAPYASDTNLNAMQDNIETAINETLLEEEMQSCTPTIQDATVNYTVQEGYYRYLNPKTILGSLVLRGEITAVSSNDHYSRIKLNIPNNPTEPWKSFAVVQEAAGATNEDVYNAVVIENDLVSLQKKDGTGACSWKVTSGFYIRVGFVLMK